MNTDAAFNKFKEAAQQIMSQKLAQPITNKQVHTNIIQLHHNSLCITPLYCGWPDALLPETTVLQVIQSTSWEVEESIDCYSERYEIVL